MRKLKKTYDYNVKVRIIRHDREDNSYGEIYDFVGLEGYITDVLKDTITIRFNEVAFQKIQKFERDNNIPSYPLVIWLSLKTSDVKIIDSYSK